MNKINLPNRDGAILWLEEESLIEPHISEWKLKVDKEHLYCLEYMRMIMSPKGLQIEAVDPSGGPFISLADEFKSSSGKNYKIVNIVNATTFWLSERNNN